MPVSTVHLTDNQQRVLEALRRANAPLSAYALREQAGLAAPMQVYRALDKLIAQGLAHRLDSLNAYIACRCTQHQAVLAFAICDRCGHVDTLSDEGIGRYLGHWLGRLDFSLERSCIELRGRCASCTQAENAADAAGASA